MEEMETIELEKKKEPEGPCDEISYRCGDLLALNADEG